MIELLVFGILLLVCWRTGCLLFLAVCLAAFLLSGCAKRADGL